MADKKISALTSASTPLAGTEVLPIVQSGTTVKATVNNVTNRAIGPTSVAIGTALDGSLQSIGLAGATDGTTYVLNKWTPSTAEPTVYDLKFTTRFAGAGATAGWQYDFISRDFYTGSKTYLRFLGGNTVLPDGNLVIGTSGKGIDFSATAGTGTSELLSDYEEGTWTPVLTPGTSGSITLTSPTDSMRYTKVGRVVTLTGLINISSVSSPVGDLRLTGLPFNLGGSGAGSISIFGLGTSSIATAYQVLVDSGSATTIFIRGYAAGNQVATVSNNMQAGGGFYLTIQYTV